MKIIYLSEKLIKDLLDKLSDIISDNSLDKRYTKERIILSVNGYKFDIDLYDNKKYNIKVEQIVHKLKK